MSFWRLTVERPNRNPEVFDLRNLSKIRIGDDPRNEVPVRSTKLPFRLKAIDKSLKGQLRLHLTREVVPTLKGSFERSRDWRTRLYSGSSFDVFGECFFKVDNTSFYIEQIEEIPLPPSTQTYDPEVTKDWFKSFGLSGTLHVLVFLIMMLASWLGGFFKTEPELEMQKVTIAQVEKVFQKKVKVPPPEKVEVAQPKPVEDVKIAKQDVTQAKTDKSVADVKSRNNLTAKGNNAPGKKGNAPPKNVNSMGLLAIQTSSAGSSKISLPVAAPTVRNRTIDPNDTGLGMGTAKYGIGNGGDEDQGIARLGSLSGQSYQGGLARGVTARTGPAIQLSRREVEVRGGLDPAIIRQIVEERLSEVRYCYETALLKHTNLAGKVSASWTITADGSVAEVASSSEEIQQNILHPCVRSQIAKWKFPSPKGGGVVHVKYPFVFNPVGG